MAADAEAIAAGLRVDPTAAVGCYQGWTLTELAGHVGQIHRWVADIVASGATARPTAGMATPPDTVEELAGWVVDGGTAVATTLGATAPDTPVWTISRRWRDVEFWRQRMLLETALHRWDVDDALGRPVGVDDAVARRGVAEALDVYLAQRLEGRAVGGDGQRVALLPTGGAGWTVTLRPDGFDVDEGADDVDVDATIAGSALDLWLLVTCRRALDGLDVTGDAVAAELAVAAAHMVPGPAG